jgi:hypothetical protein
MDGRRRPIPEHCRLLSYELERVRHQRIGREKIRRIPSSREAHTDQSRQHALGRFETHRLGLCDGSCRVRA